MDWTAAALTIKLALATTTILFVIAMPFAYWLATTRWRWKFFIEAIVTLPLILPPTVLGFYFLFATSPRSTLGAAYTSLVGSSLPFSFAGILLASVIVNLPFAVRPFMAGFASVDRQLIEASWCLGQSRWSTFRRVIFPLAWSGILGGLVLTFAHTVGEFGVVLMVGGNIPGVTRTLSVAIYDDVQALDYATAGRTSLLLVAFSVGVLTWFYSRRRPGDLL